MLQYNYLVQYNTRIPHVITSTINTYFYIALSICNYGGEFQVLYLYKTMGIVLVVLEHSGEKNWAMFLMTHMGFELGPYSWQASILPLSHQGCNNSRCKLQSI